MLVLLDTVLHRLLDSLCLVHTTWICGVAALLTLRDSMSSGRECWVLCCVHNKWLVGNGSINTTPLSVNKGSWLFYSVSKQRFVFKTHSRCSSSETKMRSRKEPGCLQRKAAAEELGISQQPPCKKLSSENRIPIQEHLSRHVNDMHCAGQSIALYVAATRLNI